MSAVFIVGEASCLAERTLREPSMQQAFDVIKSLRGIILLGHVAFGLAWAWIGYTLWSERAGRIGPNQPVG